MSVDLKYIDIDRTIYENLRQKAVDTDYLPNILEYPTTQQGKSDWLLARESIVLNKGFLVDVFGVGASMDKGELTTCRILVQRLDARNGDLTSRQYESCESGFRKLIIKKSRDITYEIRIVSRTAEQEQLLNDIIESSFSGTVKQLKVNSGRQDAINSYFTIRRQNDYNVGAYDHIERRYTYEVQDVFIQSDDSADITVVPIRTIDFSVNSL